MPVPTAANEEERYEQAGAKCLDSWSTLSLSIVVLTLVTTSALCASSEGSASGTMSRDGDTLHIVDGWASEGIGFLDSEVVRIVLVPMALDRDALAQHIDFDYEITRQRSAAGLPGYLELEIDRQTGRWRGMSYGLPQGWGCGYCSVQRHQTLDVAGRRVKGRLELDPSDDSDGDGPTVRLDIDLQIAEVTDATLLGADGGAPGQALERCWDVAKRENWEAIGELCFVPGDENFSNTQHMNDDTRSLIVFMGRGQLRADELEIGGGRMKGDFAELDLETLKDDQRYEGTMLMVETESGWRVLAQRMTQVWEE